MVARRRNLGRRTTNRGNNFIKWLLEPFQTTRGGQKGVDFTLLIIVGLLLFLGLLFLSSASSSLAFYKHQDTYRFVKQQITHGLLPGLVLFYAACRIDYRIYKKLTPVFLISSFILLILVFISNFNSGFGTAQSWISLGGLVFQPSELVKLFLILFLAGWFDKKGDDVKGLSATTIPFVIVLGIISFLIIKQPDIGTLSIIAITAMVMFYGAGARFTHLLTIVGAGLLALVAMVKAAPYRMNRITSWLNPEVDPQGIGWQIKQSLIAVGSGGWFGLGLGASRQKTYLPMPANDSIFAVIAEEIGFVFTVAFLLLFAALIMRGFHILKHSDDNYAKLAVLGITVWMAVQVFINVAGILQMAPLTGVPLPFISLGGTNLVVTLLSMGILANISRYTSR